MFVKARENPFACVIITVKIAIALKIFELSLDIVSTSVCQDFTTHLNLINSLYAITLLIFYIPLFSLVIKASLQVLVIHIL